MRLSEYLKRTEKEREKTSHEKTKIYYQEKSKKQSVEKHWRLFNRELDKSIACLPQGDLAQLRQVSEMNVLYRDCTQSCDSQKYIN